MAHLQSLYMWPDSTDAVVSRAAQFRVISNLVEEVKIFDFHFYVEIESLDVDLSCLSLIRVKLNRNTTYISVLVKYLLCRKVRN